jgi:hypothetical protein
VGDSAPKQTHLLELGRVCASVLPKPTQNNNVETVRRIINLALGDGMEIVVLMALLETGRHQQAPLLGGRDAPHSKPTQVDTHSAKEKDR